MKIEMGNCLRSEPEGEMKVNTGRRKEADDTPTVQSLRRGIYRRFMPPSDSAASIPRLTLTAATPNAQLSNSQRTRHNSVFVIQGPEIPIPNENLGQYLLNRLQAVNSKQRCFSIFEKEQLTAPELLELCRTMEEALGVLDFSPGDRVICLIANDIRIPPLAIACHLRRLPLIILNPKIVTDEVVRTDIQSLDAQAVFCVKESADAAEKLKTDVASIDAVIVLDCEESPVSGQLTLGNVLLQEIKKGSLIEVRKEEEPLDGHLEEALIAWTQGRTGRPALLRLTHHNVLASIIASLSFDFLGTKRRVLGLLPLYHPFGFTLQLYSCLASGASLALLAKTEPETLLRCIQTLKADVCLAVPPVVEFLSSESLVLNFDLRSLRTIVSTLAPIHQNIMDALFKRFPDISLHNGYGLCETGSLVLLTSGLRAAAVTVGTVLPNVACKVNDMEENCANSINKRGEICIRGPQVSGKVPVDHQAQTFLDAKRWLHTGDLGYYDVEKNFSLYGVLDGRLARRELMWSSPVIRNLEKVKNVGMTPLKMSRLRKLRHHRRTSSISQDGSEGSDNVFVD